MKDPLKENYFNRTCFSKIPEKIIRKILLISEEISFVFRFERAASKGSSEPEPESEFFLLLN